MSLVAWFGLALGLLYVAGGVRIIAASPHRQENRRLAALLLGWALVLIPYSPYLLASSPRVAHASFGASVVGNVLVPFFYLAFLSVLSTPWARPLRHPWAIRTLLFTGGAMAIAWAISWSQRSDVFLAGTRWRVDALQVPAMEFVLAGYLITSGLGLLFAWHAWRVSTGGRRRQAAAYLWAFGVVDVFIVLRTLAFRFRPDLHAIIDIIDLAGLFAFLVLLSYGVLSRQVLDIDLRLKWTISRGTVASVFLAVFFVVGLGASEFIIDRLGYVFGAIAAGLLFFALRPLQRLGEKVANAAMPNVSDTDEYRMVRKRDVYQAAYESALADGNVSEKEKDVLATLAQSLGLGPADVRAIERSTT